MRENHLPVHNKSAEETGRIQPAVDSGVRGVHIHATHLSSSGRLSMASPVAFASPASSGPSKPDSVQDPQHSTKVQNGRNSKLGTWLPISAVFLMATLYTTLYHPEWVPSFAAHTAEVSADPPIDIKKSDSIPLNETASTENETDSGKNNSAKTETAKIEAGTLDGGADIGLAPVSSKTVDRSAVQHHGTTSGASQPTALGKDETKTLKNLHPPTQIAKVAFSQIEFAKVADSKKIKSNKNILVPPPPPTPCILPPTFGFLPLQPGQDHTDAYQQLQQAQAPLKTHNHSAARENTLPQANAASSKGDATQSAALDAADQELQSALNSSHRTVGEWTH